MDETLFIIILAVAAILGSKSLRKYAAILILPGNTGKAGERKVARILKRAFRRTHHQIFNDILLEHGEFITQIDHLVISTKGIFVVETKDLKGWVFGSPGNSTWTQTLRGEKYKFMNPLRQNYKHQKVLENMFSIKSTHIESIVVFADRCIIKTDVPDNVIYASKLKKYIKAQDQISLPERMVDRLSKDVLERKLSNTRKNRRRHRKHVKDVKKGK